jgi:hypothetical protein
MTRTLAAPVTRRALGIGAALAAGLALAVLVHLVPVESGPPMGARLLLRHSWPGLILLAAAGALSASNAPRARRR